LLALTLLAFCGAADYGRGYPEATDFAFADLTETGTPALIDSSLDCPTRGTARPIRTLDNNADSLYFGGISFSFNGATTKIRLRTAVALQSSLNRKRREVAFILINIIQRYFYNRSNRSLSRI
jgi:hypothetical protein